MRALSLLLAASSLIAAPQSWIIDTDAGTDDYLAIAYLLRKPDFQIEAITSVNGLAHARKGAEVAKRILELGGKPGTPVYAGADKPLSGNAAFPDEWRKMSEDLPNVKLPELSGKLESQSAADFLAERLKRPAPFSPSAP